MEKKTTTTVNTIKENAIASLPKTIFLFFIASPTNDAKGNNPTTETNNGNRKNPPCPSLGAAYLQRLCSKKNALVHSPFVASCTNTYHGNAVAKKQQKRRHKMPGKKILPVSFKNSKDEKSYYR